MSNELSDWRGMHEAMGKALDGETAESWHKVHAQLLKSVADAQGKLLAAQNETNDRLERMDRDLRVLIGQTQETVRSCHGNISGRLVGFEALLAKPRRQVERLRTKRILKPQRKR